MRLPLLLLLTGRRGRREARRELSGRLVNVYVESAETLRRDFVRGRLPDLLWRSARSSVLIGDAQLGNQVIRLAQSLVRDPPKIPRSKALRMRHDPEDLLRRLETRHDEDLVEQMLAHALAAIAIEVVLAKNARWSRERPDDSAVLAQVSPVATLFVTRLVRADSHGARVDAAHQLVDFLRDRRRRTVREVSYADASAALASSTLSLWA